MGWIVTVQRIEGELRVALPGELIERQNLAEGDTLFVVEREDGLLLVPCDPKFDEVMEAYGDLSTHYRNTLRELAKGAAEIGVSSYGQGWNDECATSGWLAGWPFFQ